MASLLSAVYRQDDDTTMPENGGEEEVVDNHNKWEVYKFGGTSVASAERMRVAAKLTRARQTAPCAGNKTRHMAVVVSAVGGKPKTTDLLLSCIDNASDETKVEKILQQIRAKHLDVVHKLGFLVDDEAAAEGRKVKKEDLGDGDGDGDGDETGSGGDGDGDCAAVCVMSVIDRGLEEIRAVAATARLIGHAPEALRDIVAGFGELWSTRMLTLLLNEEEKAKERREEEEAGKTQLHRHRHRYVFLDARRFITISPASGFTPLTVDYPESERRLRLILKGEEEKVRRRASRWRRRQRSEGRNGSASYSSPSSSSSASSFPKQCPSSSKESSSSSSQESTSSSDVSFSFSIVVTGFICRTQSGSVATLQRDGSDYSAAIVGRLLRASAITIWTDVDGVLSADPRAVPDARCLQSLSYAEAMELSYFGAKVMHPRTMHPAVLADIPIYMRNSFNPSHPGTKIWAGDVLPRRRSALRRDLTAASERSELGSSSHSGVNTPLPSPPSSVRGVGGGGGDGGSSSSSSNRREGGGEGGDRGGEGGGGEGGEISTIQQRHLLRTVSSSSVDATHAVTGLSSVKHLSLLNFEGSFMMGIPGIAKRLFAALEEARVNILFIAQASSEHSICIATLRNEAERACDAVAAAFHREIFENVLEPPEVSTEPAAIVAIVGDDMSFNPGVAGHFFSALARAKINVMAISQGSSERNISAVIREDDVRSALRAVHAAFGLGEEKTKKTKKNPVSSSSSSYSCASSSSPLLSVPMTTNELDTLKRMLSSPSSSSSLPPSINSLDHPDLVKLRERILSSSTK